MLAAGGKETEALLVGRTDLLVYPEWYPAEGSGFCERPDELCADPELPDPPAGRAGRGHPPGAHHLERLPFHGKARKDECPWRDCVPGIQALPTA